MIKGLLLAAGFGTRLRPLTDEWPKCLMPISGRPLLEYWLQTLHSLEILDVLVNTHFHADKVNAFLARDWFAGWVQSVHEVELQGTAGTFRANASFFRGCTTMLAHADNWCQCDFSAFINYHSHQRPENCPITMMTYDADEPERCGIVECSHDGVVTAFYEKVANPPGNLANAAVYLLEPEVLVWLEQHPEISDFSTEVLPRYIGRIATWHNDAIQRDIGTLPALLAAQSDPVPHHYWPGDDEWQMKFEALPVFRAVNEPPCEGVI